MQQSDVSEAVAEHDVFDFLIDIVPRPAPVVVAAMQVPKGTEIDQRSDKNKKS